MIIGRTAEMRRITVVGLDENNFGHLRGEGRFQVGFESGEWPKVITSEDPWHPPEHHGKKGEPLMVHAPAYTVLSSQS